MKIEITALLGIVMVTGCRSTVEVNPQHYRMERPEVSTEPLQTNLGAGYVAGRAVALEDSQASGHSGSLLGRLGISLGRGFEVGVSSTLMDTTRYSGKYQFWGDGADRADAGNWSQAVSLSLEQSDSSGTQVERASTLWPATTDPIKSSTRWDAELLLYDAAWIIGYRPHARWLWYGGPYLRFGRVAVDWRQEAGSEVKAVMRQVEGRIWGANLALEYRLQWGLGMTVEAVYADRTFDSFWTGLPKQRDRGVEWNLLLDYRF